jgi:hypothetical protein
MAAKFPHVTGSSESQTASPRRTARAVRDLAADWKRWSVAERITAAVVVVLLVLAISTLAALG